MKKLLFVIAALASCMSISAKFWVEGEVYYKNSSQYYVEDNTVQWGLVPTAGMSLNDKLSVGLGIGLEGYKQGDDDYTDIMINPFARYTLIESGDFSLFAQCGVGYSHTTYGDGSWSLWLNIRPGIKYSFDDNFAVVAKMSCLYFSHDSNDGMFTAKNNFDLDLDSSLFSFGLIYEF